MAVLFSLLLCIQALKEKLCLSFPTDLPYGWEKETDEKGQIIYVEYVD